MQDFGNFDGVDNPLMDFKTNQQQLGPVKVLGNFGGKYTPLMTSKLKENELNGANGSTIISIGLGISLIM